MFLFNRTILFKVFTVLSLCGLAWLFLEEHVTTLINDQLNNNNNNNIIANITVPTIIVDPSTLDSEELNELLEEKGDQIDFISTETDSDIYEGDPNQDEIERREELVGEVSIKEMVKLEEQRLLTVEREPHITPYEMFMTELTLQPPSTNPLPSTPPSRGDRGKSRENLMKNGGAAPVYINRVGRPKVKGEFSYFIENEYELLLSGNLGVDSYWKAAVGTSRNVGKLLNLLPGIVVIGVMKAGTTSLHNLLAQHPQIVAPTRSGDFSKEAHFYDRPENYHFIESYISLWEFNGGKGSEQVTEEATPSYIYFPLAPWRMKSVYQGRPVKIVVLLRDPVSRAFSHCHHAWGKVCSPAVFDGIVNEAIKEIEFFEQSFNGSTSDPWAHFILQNCNPHEGNIPFDTEAKFFHEKFGRDHRFWSAEYLLRGMYANQLKRWFRLFGRENFYFLETPDFDEEIVQGAMSKLYSWLGLSQFDAEWVKANSGGNYKTKTPMWESTKQKLTIFYTKYNQELFELMGKRLYWTT
eukprot:TRINITY_DN1072_c0_g1_i1.p1 TRINITY_DN1072_c0_g1~~TRINITY_DN1072_c0_g1_i1.p1  ORF type:complete len:523 (+),score=74.24 TRINITY_DN1072_c0_g1_i1:180-1748(+)